jgi:hypothetical protein
MSSTSFPSDLTSAKLQNFSVGAIFLILSAITASTYYTIKDIEKDFHELDQKVDHLTKTLDPKKS